jgi:hypothetical protein
MYHPLIFFDLSLMPYPFTSSAKVNAADKILHFMLQVYINHVATSIPTTMIFAPHVNITSTASGLPQALTFVAGLASCNPLLSMYYCLSLLNHQFCILNKHHTYKRT